MATAFARMHNESCDALFLLPRTLDGGLSSLLMSGDYPLSIKADSLCRYRGLLSYGPDFYEQFRRAAVYVDRILKGANPADLPVEQPTKFELAINLKTAKALGLMIPHSISIVGADKVIE